MSLDVYKRQGNNDFYIAVPTDVTEVEKRAFYELVADSKVKAKNIYIVCLLYTSISL